MNNGISISVTIGGKNVGVAIMGALDVAIEKQYGTQEKKEESQNRESSKNLKEQNLTKIDSVHVHTTSEGYIVQYDVQKIAKGEDGLTMATVDVTFHQEEQNDDPNDKGFEEDNGDADRNAQELIQEEGKDIKVPEGIDTNEEHDAHMDDSSMHDPKKGSQAQGKINV
jgi:hypothetical protein